VNCYTGKCGIWLVGIVSKFVFLDDEAATFEVVHGNCKTEMYILCFESYPSSS